MARLLEQYKQTVQPALMEKFGIANMLAAPCLQKVVVSMGVGSAIEDKERLSAAGGDLALITGQHPVTTKARKSVSGFKLREGMPIGLKVTLRGKRMYEFLDRLISAAVPRIRDFRGLPVSAFDGHGNYSLGLVEQTIFPEISPDKIQHSQGMNITIVIANSNDEMSRELLAGLGMPFKRPESEAEFNR